MEFAIQKTVSAEEVKVIRQRLHLKQKELADLMVMVPEKECMFAQELHLPIYHCWCMMLEDYFFGE